MPSLHSPPDDEPRPSLASLPPWLRPPVGWLRRVGSGLLDVLYPPRCLGCSARPVSVALPLCATCLQTMERASAEAIAARLDRLEAARVLDGAFALWVFDKNSALQAVQHALKYGDRPRYGLALGRLVGDAYAETHPAPDAVVPIPLHRIRELERGYNQAEMLARGLAEALDCPVRPDGLTRPRPTRSQTRLSRSARWQNVADAFGAPDAIADDTVLLVDDVLTTGATVAAAARRLKEAGAGRVFVATLAMART